MSKVIFIMGVSGSGKTSISKKLSILLKLDYLDADDYHTSQNIEKMKSGVALTDEDRFPWLDTLNKLAQKYSKSGCIIACSALKQIYRDRLSQNLKENVIWVYLKGDYELIYERMKSRKNHFMKPDMLLSQLATLEEPAEAIKVDVSETFDSIIRKIKNKLL